MKLASIVIAVIMSLSMAACGGSTQKNQPNPIPSATQSVSQQENPYEDLTNCFVRPISFFIDFNADDYDIFIGTWGDTDGHASLKFASYDADPYEYTVIVNENYTIKKMLSVEIDNPDKQEFSDFLSTLDWHPDTESNVEYPYGYILTEDSAILVTSEDSNITLYNVKALADVLGIDIQQAVTSVESTDDVEDIIYNLIDSLQYGVRGYPIYMKRNPNGAIIDNYEDLVYALNNPYDSELKDIYTEINGFYDSRNQLEEIYENDNSQSESHSSSSGNGHTYFYNQLPSDVQQYIDAGYRVYMIEHGLAKGYYIAQNDGQGKMFTLICSSNPNTSTQPDQVLYSDTGNHIGSGYSVTDITNW